MFRTIYMNIKLSHITLYHVISLSDNFHSIHFKLWPAGTIWPMRQGQMTTSAVPPVLYSTCAANTTNSQNALPSLQHLGKANTDLFFLFININVGL